MTQLDSQDPYNLEIAGGKAKVELLEGANANRIARVLEGWLK